MMPNQGDFTDEFKPSPIRPKIKRKMERIVCRIEQEQV